MEFIYFNLFNFSESNNVAFCGLRLCLNHSISCSTTLLPGITSVTNLAYFLPSSASLSVLKNCPQKRLFLCWTVTARPGACSSVSLMFPGTLQWKDLIFPLPVIQPPAVQPHRWFPYVLSIPMSPTTHTLNILKGEKVVSNVPKLFFFVQNYLIALCCCVIPHYRDYTSTKKYLTRLYPRKI